LVDGGAVEGVGGNALGEYGPVLLLKTIPVALHLALDAVSGTAKARHSLLPRKVLEAHPDDGVLPRSHASQLLPADRLSTSLASGRSLMSIGRRHDVQRLSYTEGRGGRGLGCERRSYTKRRGGREWVGV
jgi:hypothetical protein